ncbi:hypothetical protein JKP88DRAFT_244513 [Tribonema minus]|uniref:Uncharacterized protein n=1 Tax=Tribonema minus TaxID=303371 RepID=A0A835Z3D4_9STRA|nr:hypothetical protein JKP88DRAFT_244513 [Tribonema minus]
MAEEHVIAHMTALELDVSDKAAVHAALLAYVDERSRIYAAYQLLSEADRVAFKAQHGGFMCKRETYANIISSARKQLIAGGDRLHEHFTCPVLTAEVKAAYAALVKSWEAKGKYLHPAAEVREIWKWAGRVVKGEERCGIDILSVAIMIVTGARHMEIVCSKFEWVETGEYEVKHKLCRKGKTFAVNKRDGTTDVRVVDLLLASAADVMAAVQRVRASLGDDPKQVTLCKQRASNAIKSRKTGKSMYPLLAAVIDGYKAWFVGRNATLHLIRQMYDCMEIKDHGKPDTIAGTAERLGHRAPAYHCAQGYRLFGLKDGLSVDAEADAEGEGDAADEGGVDGATDGGADAANEGGVDGAAGGGTDAAVDEGGADASADGGTDAAADGGTDGTDGADEGGADGADEGGADGADEGGADGADATAYSGGGAAAAAGDSDDTENALIANIIHYGNKAERYKRKAERSRRHLKRLLEVDEQKLEAKRARLSKYMSR